VIILSTSVKTFRIAGYCHNSIPDRCRIFLKTLSGYSTRNGH